MIKRCKVYVLVPLVAALLVACGYTKLLRPSVLKQLNPDVVAMVNVLPDVDHPNEAILGRLFVHGGLTHAEVGDDGIMRAVIRVPLREYIWKPAIIVMPHGGQLQVDISNDDVDHHMAFMPSDGGRRILDLPSHTRGRIEIGLTQPGLYWFGCPVADHAGRGMLGLIIVKGDLPPDARLDRPPQPQP